MKMTKRFSPSSSQSGQVLITGIIMLSILLLIIVYAFDVHNVIRAKLKVDIAQQSAAMTGAAWQKESLNLLGEINILKASALLMEGSDNWKTPLPERTPENETLWRQEMQSRIDLLTEMQTRVSFIGPLIGFAAAQQAAKANGLDRIGGAFNTYLELLRTDKRYDPAQGGAPQYINNYAWKEPYINLVSDINDSGIAIFPNARTAGMPRTRPAQLANEKFYTEIMKAAASISYNDPPKKHYWNLLASILRTMDDKDFQGKWWDISYANNKFPNESEIFTLGVEFNDEYNEETFYRLNSLKSDLNFYADQGSLPGQMKWCVYDQWWFPDYYRNNYPEYENSHYNYWYGGSVLRKEVKEGFIYEGPAAYAEGYADVTALVSVRPATRPYDRSIAKRDALEAVKSKDNPVLLKKQRTTSRVGTRRSQADDSNVSTGYRPGSIAKVLGAFTDEKPPIVIDPILPVFKQVSPMPTFMPIPYGFQVLKPGYSNLEKFLSWLSEQENLSGTPPAGTEHYLEALRFLVNGVRGRAAGERGKTELKEGSYVEGKALRYYGYNHKFDKAAFEREFKDRLWEWDKVRDKRCFQQGVYDGPGWLQEPEFFSSTPAVRRVRVTETDKNGKVIEKKYYVITREERSGVKSYIVDETTHKAAVPDSINGGTAYRVYVNVTHGSTGYYVINSKGQIVLNGSPDPTILYNQYYGGSGGKCNCEGECTCKSVWQPGSYDGVRGPTRL